MAWVYTQVKDNISELMLLQTKYDIVILDLPNNSHLLPGFSGMFSKPLAIQPSEPITIELPSKSLAIQDIPNEPAIGEPKVKTHKKSSRSKNKDLSQVFSMSPYPKFKKSKDKSNASSSQSKPSSELEFNPALYSSNATEESIGSLSDSSVPLHEIAPKKHHLKEKPSKKLNKNSLNSPSKKPQKSLGKHDTPPFKMSFTPEAVFSSASTSTNKSEESFESSENTLPLKEIINTAAPIINHQKEKLSKKSNQNSLFSSPRNLFDKKSSPKKPITTQEKPDASSFQNPGFVSYSSQSDNITEESFDPTLDNTVLSKVIINTVPQIVAHQNEMLDDATMDKLWHEALFHITNQAYQQLGTLLVHNDDIGFRDTFHNKVKISNPQILPLINILHDKNKDTLLHYAVNKNNINLIQWLIYYGASVFVLGHNNLTPLSLAAELTTDENAIFSTLIKKAQIESAPNSAKIEKFDDLCNLSNQLGGDLHRGLAQYNSIVEGRQQGVMSIYYSIKKLIEELRGRDFSIQRNLTVAKAYYDLANAESSRNYQQLLSELSKLNKIPDIDGSKLHEIIDEVEKKGSALIKTISYDKEYNSFFERNGDNTLDLQYKTQALALNALQTNKDVAQLRELAKKEHELRVQQDLKIDQMQLKIEKQESINVMLESKYNNLEAQMARIMQKFEQDEQSKIQRKSGEGFFNK